MLHLTSMPALCALVTAAVGAPAGSTTCGVLSRHCWLWTALHECLQPSWHRLHVPHLSLSDQGKAPLHCTLPGRHKLQLIPPHALHSYHRCSSFSLQSLAHFTYVSSFPLHRITLAATLCCCHLLQSNAVAAAAAHLRGLHPSGGTTLNIGMSGCFFSSFFMYSQKGLLNVLLGGPENRCF